MFMPRSLWPFGFFFLLMLIPGWRAPDVPSIVVTKRDLLFADADADNLADPGDTLSYTIWITNTGTTDGEGVLFDDTIDANTTLLPGSVRTTPLARNDVYAVTADTQLTVTAASGLLANDNDPDGSAVSVDRILGGCDSLSSCSTANDGIVSANPDGSFVYDPPPGFVGVDSFPYLAVDTDGNGNRANVFLVVQEPTGSRGATAPAPIEGPSALRSPAGDGSPAAPTGENNAPLAPAAGERLTVTLGLMNPGEMVRLQFEVAINTQLDPPSTLIVCNQALVRGVNFSDEFSDDPDVIGFPGPTCTTLDRSGLVLTGTLQSTGSVHLDWNDGNDAPYSSYELWHSTLPYGSASFLAAYTVSEADVAVNGLQNDYYHVVALKDGSPAGQSNRVGVFTMALTSGDGQSLLPGGTGANRLLPPRHSSGIGPELRQK